MGAVAAAAATAAAVDGDGCGGCSGWVQLRLRLLQLPQWMGAAAAAAAAAVDGDGCGGCSGWGRLRRPQCTEQVRRLHRATAAAAAMGEQEGEVNQRQTGSSLICVCD